MRAKARRPADWPTIAGRPATSVEIVDFCNRVEAHYTAPRVSTAPHFCNRCTQPLEHEPCHVCWSAFFEGRVRELRAMVAL